MWQKEKGSWDLRMDRAPIAGLVCALRAQERATTALGTIPIGVRKRASGRQKQPFLTQGCAIRSENGPGMSIERNSSDAMMTLGAEKAGNRKTRIVLFDPGVDMFRIEGDDLAQARDRLLQLVDDVLKKRTEIESKKISLTSAVAVRQRLS